MKRIYFVLYVAMAVLLCSFQTPEITPTELLKSIDIIDSIKEIRNDNFFECTYEVWFRMPIDHNNPNSEYFPLRAYYSHKGFDRPMLAVLDGYTMYTSRANELAIILDANQLTIEHRFFSNSRPKDSIPWTYLTVEQAAADQHAIIQVFKQYYKGKWVSTGISKSGQTTIFHRCLYPADVDVSVPYVAPLNFSNEDPRVYDFLANVGSKECRKKIYKFQKTLFRKKSDLFPMFEELAQQYGWEFVMGLDRAYDLAVLEFNFAFWQWGADCDAIPKRTAPLKEIFNYWKSLDVFSFFDEQSIETTRPFFYQAMTEIGMYGYEVKPFHKFLDDKENITFDFTMPKGYEHAAFNVSTMEKVDKWVKESGNYILYIYGQNDAWSSTAVDVGDKTNAVIMFNPGGSHASRIKSFPSEMQDSIYHVLSSWLDMEVPVKK